MRELPGESIPAAAKLYYPSRMALAADGQTAFVVSVNFDQRFFTGWVSSIDVPTLLGDVAAGGDGTAALTRQVAIPSLGGDFVLDGPKQRAYVAHRGLGLVTALDVATPSAGAATLSCGEAGNGLLGALARTSCDARHIFALKSAVGDAFMLRDDPVLEHFDDAFALTEWTPQQGGQTHLIAGLQRGQRMAILRDDGSQNGIALEGLLPTGTRGILAVAAAPNGPLIASSRAIEHDGSVPFARDQAQLLALGSLAPTLVQRPGQALPLPLPNYSLTHDLGALQQDQGRSQIAALMFVPGRSDRVVALSHSPDALLWLGLTQQPQTSIDVGGSVSAAPGELVWQPLSAAMIPKSQAHALAYLPRAQGDLIVAASFTQDTLYFFDASGDDLQLVHRLALPDGAGPFGMVATQVDGRELLLVSTFFDHGLSVVDVSTPSYADFAILTSLHDDLFAIAPRHR